MPGRLSMIALAAAAASVALTLSAGGCRKESGRPPAAATAQGAAVFVNGTCPIMGTPIDPANVTPDLVREYKGQKVAFCCAMCPPQWDKLTDAEKDAKLDKSPLRE